MVTSNVYHAPEYNYVATLGPLKSASGRAHISLIVSVIEVRCDECLIVQTSDMVFPNSPSTCDLVRPHCANTNVKSGLSIHSIAGTSRVPGDNLASYPMLFLSPDVALKLSEVWFCPCEVKRVCQLSLNHILN